MSNFDDFEDDDQEPQGANVAVKFTFPGGLARSLNLYKE